MSKDCQRTSLITALATCSGLSEGGQGHRFTGARTRYSYVLPLVGSVYRTAFQTVFNVSNNTITRHRNQVKRGEFALPALPAHGNTGNKHAQFVDEEAMKAFILRLAETHADVVPVRFRYQKPGNGMTSRQSTTKEYLLLPAYFSWVMMLGWYVAWANDARAHFKEPSVTSFTTILERICPNIPIRSTRDNLCDDCVIYRNMMGPEPSVEDTEAITAHVRNNYVLQFLLFLVHTGSLQSAKLSFLVKGHTKNHCDRHFGYIKRYYAKQDL
ncbi:hypothetical protein PR001_g6894 [Phytophthora rubi]|nr:hypothetical protein PR001_g6894 [Phytophthora rubi]